MSIIDVLIFYKRSGSVKKLLINIFYNTDIKSQLKKMSGLNKRLS